MAFRGRHLRVAAFLMALSLCPTLARADEGKSNGQLKAATIAASAAAAADWISTYHALKYYKVREVNPVLRPFDSSPAHVVWVGAAIDVSLMSAWQIGVTRAHPKLGVSGLWAMTVFRSYLAVHNMRNEQRAARR